MLLTWKGNRKIYKKSLRKNQLSLIELKKDIEDLLQLSLLLCKNMKDLNSNWKDFIKFMSKNIEILTIQNNNLKDIIKIKKTSSTELEKSFKKYKRKLKLNK